MALNCTLSSQIFVQKSGSFPRVSHKDFMSKRSSLSSRKAPRLLTISASINNNKIYEEDESEGIVCYTDGRGEMICEGYDEGPRFPRIPAPTCHHPRDAEIMNLLMQQSLLQIVKGEETNPSVHRLLLSTTLQLQRDSNLN